MTAPRRCACGAVELEHEGERVECLDAMPGEMREHRAEWCALEPDPSDDTRPDLDCPDCGAAAGHLAGCGGAR